MKRNLIFALLTAAALFAAGPAGAAAPTRINFQGRLQDAGAPVTGTRSFVFKMYDALTGGTLLWTSQTTSVNVDNGVFSIVLETGTPSNLSSAYFSGPRYVEIAVGGTLLSPREEVVSAPYALVAQALSSDSVVPLANLEKDPSAASTINKSTNPVDWTALKNVPAGFADGVDDTGGTLTIKEGGATVLTPATTLDFDASQFNVSAAAPTAGVALSPSSVTLQGNTFNGVGQLVRLDPATGKLPVLDGSALTNVSATTLADGSVTLAKMANLAANSLIGNNTGVPAVPLALTATQAKTLLGLDNVENTKLSTWGGSTGITTLGTIGTGSWNADVIANGKIAAALSGKTYDGITLTALGSGFTAAGGTTSKTLTVSGDANVSGTNTGDQTITLTGDVTGSGTGSFAATIGAGKVTLAQMATMATASILGRNTAGTGAPEVLNAATVKSILSLGSVENTALSSWAGSANITTLGTIGTGSWNATAIPDNKIAAALTGKTYNGITLTALGTGFTAAGGTTSKTLTVSGDANVSGTNTGDQTITLTGDVTGSGTGSFAATIGAGKVTLAQMATMATASILGRNTAGTGAPEVLNAATVKTLLGLNNVDNTSLASWAGSANLTTLGTIGTGSWNADVIANGKIAAALSGKTYDGITLTALGSGFTAAGGTTSKTLTVSGDANVSGTNTGDQTITLTGDVTGSGTGSFAATIGAGKVTLAQMATMATASLLGRNTAGTGAPEVLNAATVKTLLGLNNVDNTSLASWAGSTNLTTLGTIGTGSWNADVIANGKIATALSGKTYDGITLTALGTGFTAAGGSTTSKTLTVSGDANVSGTNTGDQTITLTGDVTGSGTGSFAATIGAGAVTDAKIASVSAYKASHYPLLVKVAYTVTSTDTIVLADASSAAFDVTLPAASAATVGKEFSIYNMNPTKFITVKPASGEYLNGAADGSKTAAAQFQYARVIGVYDGTNYGWVCTLVGP